MPFMCFSTLTPLLRKAGEASLNSLERGFVIGSCKNLEAIGLNSGVCFLKLQSVLTVESGARSFIGLSVNSQTG